MPEAKARSSSRESSRAATRDALVGRAVAHVSKRGLRDTSLRSIAAQLDTSHRMLIYHFGSAEEFWTAVMARLRARDRGALREAAARGRVPLIGQTWASLAAPSNLPMMRLFFETYGRALADRARFHDFLAEIVDGWLETVGDALATQYRLTPAQARVQARLRLAVLRGLLLDLLTTGDRAGTTAALALFARRARLTPRRAPRPKKKKV